MTDADLIARFRQLRTAQAAYFRTRAQADLIESKRLEKLVDTEFRNRDMQPEIYSPPNMRGMFYIVNNIVGLFYSDGTLCAEIAGNLGLDISASQAAHEICQAVNR